MQGTWAFVSADLLQHDSRSHDILDDIESIMWVLLYVASRSFQYEGKFNTEMFDERYTPAPGCLYQGPSGGGSKSLWLIGFYNISFPCRPLQAFFDSSREFHWKREEKARIARVRQRKEDLEDLQRHFDETKGNLNSLLDSFDAILHDDAADWSHGTIQVSTQDTVPVAPPALPERSPPLPSPPRNKKRRQDPEEENAPPAKRSRGDKEKSTEVSKPRRRRAAPIVPRKVYNLRPRKKPQ